MAVTREVETAALEALAAVHACGLLHGDVSLSNIMVVWGKKPTVRILDFGFSCITSNKKLQEAERVRLKRLFFTHGGAAGEEANDARYPCILPC